MSKPEDDQATRDDSALCTRCGLCCDGTLFARMRVAPDEAALAARAEAAPFVDAGNAYAPQPCSFLDDCACTVYPERYAICRAYRCRLLRELDAGRIDRGIAAARVAEAQRLRDVARAASIAAGSSDFSIASSRRDERWAGPADPAARRAVGEAHLAGAALALFLAKHFHARRVRESVEAGSNPS